MQSTILSGASASGVITPGPSQGIQVENIDFSLPSSGTLSNASVTLSGSITGAMSFSSDINAVIRFYKDEVVNLTTSNFAAGYAVAINYVVYGSQEAYLNTRNMDAIPLPSRLTRRTPRSS